MHVPARVENASQAPSAGKKCAPPPSEGPGETMDFGELDFKSGLPYDKVQEMIQEAERLKKELNERYEEYGKLLEEGNGKP